MWVSNAYSNDLVSNQESPAPSIAAAFTAHYDTSVEIVSMRLRDGEPKYVVEGSGHFAIFADENGVWGVDLEVVKWDGDYGEVINALSRAGVEVW
ncbi:hypothetical protein [Thermocladium modestius]|nr:hypothetical protein [Thermocladium modestius]